MERPVCIDGDTETRGNGEACCAEACQARTLAADAVRRCPLTEMEPGALRIR